MADDLEVITTDGNCSDIKFNEIPVANFSEQLTLPLIGETKGWRRTQRYNTSWSNPDCYKPGHNGIDVGGEYSGWAVGIEELHNVLRGKVFISRWMKGWGNSTTIVSRVNEYSNELITTSYHHQDVRYVSHCKDVYPGQLIGMEGKSGDDKWLPHLHFTVRRWANLDHLLNWLNGDTRGYNVFGENAYFGHNGIRFKGSYNPGSQNIKEDSPYYNYGHLSPESLLFNYYTDYQLSLGQKEPTYFWSLPYVLKMRKYGIEFGLWDGSYGAQHEVKRREISRWLKIGANVGGMTPQVETFNDVDQSDPDYLYIESMTRYPMNVPVINPNHSCNEESYNFCPDNNVNRAEALKMVVLAFYSSAYLKMYNDDIWTVPTNVAMQHLMKFKDVNPSAWYASYVYFGAMIGLVKDQEQFNPTAPVMREEMAKWIITGYELINGSTLSVCNNTVCDSNEFCQENTGTCEKIPECIPTETQECEAGGGYTQEDPCQTGAVCQTGETKTQQCGNGGNQSSVCTDECQWGQWSDCVGSGNCSNGTTSNCGNCGTMTCQNNNWGPCQNQGVCTASQTQQQSCNGTGTQTRVCTSACSWGQWENCSIQPVCSPGQVQQQNCNIGGQTGTQTRTCNSNGQWNSWEQCVTTCACSSGTCCDGCNYKSTSTACDSWQEYRCEGINQGQDAQYMNVTHYCPGNSTSCNGQTSNSSWMTYDNCSSSEKCVMNGSTPQCVSSCTDTYVTSTSSSCYSGNPNGVNICLKLQKVSGATFRYQVCKSGSPFQNNVKYEIVDIKDSSHYLNSGTGGAGSYCTPWKTISMSYITEYGSSNGATLRGQLYSPSTCTQSQCYYRSSLITVNLECQ